MRVREPAVGFCGPQRLPGGEARDVGLCPNHAVLRFLQLGLLGGRVVLRILTLVVEYHRAVMKIVLAGPLQRERDPILSERWGKHGPSA